MNMIKAAEETLVLSKRYGFDIYSPNVENTDYLHLVEMLQKMKEGSFSKAKIGRWLGWIQACVVIGTLGQVTLEDCKRINRNFSEDE